MDYHNWILAIVSVGMALSTLLSWVNRQTIAQMALRSERDMASMELRLSEKIGQTFVTWQAHNDLLARLERLEDKR